MKRPTIILISAVLMAALSAKVFAAPSARERLRNEMARERRDFEFDRREINQAKYWDARLNKVVTDVHGNRVRVEEFVTRPAANQVRFIALSKRKNRLDYMWFLQEFNKDLPKDIEGIVFQFDWAAKPEIYPTKQHRFLSNTIDSFETIWADEKPILVNQNQVDAFWMVWPDSITDKINERTKYYQDNTTDPITLIPGMPSYTGGDYPDGPQYQRVDYTWDSTFMTRTRYIIDDNGRVQKLYLLPEDIRKIQDNYNIQLVYTASEFEDRNIDIVIVPRIFSRYRKNEGLGLGALLVFF